MGIPRRVQELWGAYNNIEPNSFNRRILDTKAGRFNASRSNFLNTIDSSYNIDSLASLGNTIRARVLGVTSVIPSRSRFPDLYERTTEALNDGSGGSVEEHYIFSLRSEFDFHIRNPDSMESTQASVNAALMNGVAISNVPSVQFGPVGAGDIVEVYLPNKNSYTGARVIGVTIRNNVNALQDFAQITTNASGPFASLVHGAAGAAGGFAGGFAGGVAGVGVANGFNPSVALGNYELDPNDPTRSLYLSSLWVEEEREHGFLGGSGRGRKRYNNPYGSASAIFKTDGQADYAVPSINDQEGTEDAVVAAFPGLAMLDIASLGIHPGRLIRNFIKWCSTDDARSQEIPWRDGETKTGREIYDEVMNQIWANDKENYLTSNDPGTRAVGWFREWRRAPVKERRWPRSDGDGTRPINIGVELRRIFHGHSSSPPPDPAYTPPLAADFSNQYCAYICWDAWAQALGEMGLRLINGHPHELLLNPEKTGFVDSDAADLADDRLVPTFGGANAGVTWSKGNDYTISRNLHMGIEDPRQAKFGQWSDPENYFPIMPLGYQDWGQHRHVTSRLQFNQLLKSQTLGKSVEKYFNTVDDGDPELLDIGNTASLPGGLRPGDILGRVRDTQTEDQLSSFNRENLKYIGFDPEKIDIFPNFENNPSRKCTWGGSTSEWAKQLETQNSSHGHAEMVVYVWGDGIVWQVGGNTSAGGSAQGGNLFESMFRIDNPNFNTKDNTCLIIGGPESPYGPIINPITGEEVMSDDGTTPATILIDVERKGRTQGYLRPQWGCPADGPYGETVPYPALIPGTPPPPISGPVIPPVIPDWIADTLGATPSEPAPET